VSTNPLQQGVFSYDEYVPEERSMSIVNHQIKSQLAKLLATEDLVVEHRKVETAQFNVHTRVLTLPLWEKASNDIYDLLVAHEVGHALYTPDEDWREKVNVPGQFVNIVEDVRIEKLIKRRYAGLPKTFFRGYKELNEDDFFCVGDENVNTFNLADRINLFYKVGNFVDVQFTPDEQKIVDLIGAAESFEDALNAAQVLYDYCKKEGEETISVAPSTDESAQGSSMQNGESVEQETENPELQDGEGDGRDDNRGTDESQSPADIDAQGDSTGGFDNVETKTDRALAEKLRDLASINGPEIIYLESPKVNSNTIVVSNQEFHDHVRAEFVLTDYDRDAWNKTYQEFKKEAQREVNYLVKEFECRKTADAYARATTSKTGVLDTRSLHTYKFNEDLFKKITILPDGKNHGLVFVLDWSGSMEDYLVETVKQLFTLAWFCKKVAIPFDVYMFTNSWARVVYDDETGDVTYPKPHTQLTANKLFIDESFSMINGLTSSISSTKFDQQLKTFWCLANGCVNRWGGSRVPPRADLSGTPLSEAMISLHTILPEFQRKNKLQKVQCIILTDGEGCSTQYGEEVAEPQHDGGSNLKLRKRHLAYSYCYNRDICFRNRKTGKVYSVTNTADISNMLITDLRDTFPQVNFVGIRILTSGQLNRFLAENTKLNPIDRLLVCKSFKKDHSVAIKTDHFHRYFGMSGHHMNVSDDFEVVDGASKAQIKKSFMKSLQSKKMNKKILSEFVELIA
jgi:hypothetical protein